MKINLHFLHKGMALTAAFPIDYVGDLRCEKVFEIVNAEWNTDYVFGTVSG